MTKQNPDISVSIVNHNSFEYLICCLQSLKQTSSGLKIEVLIVDNASREFLPERIYRVFPDAILTLNEMNRGFAFGHNQNFALSNAKYFLLLNPDTLITQNVLQATIDAFQSLPQVAIIGPNLASPNGKRLINVKAFPTLSSAVRDLSYVDILFSRTSSGNRFADLSRPQYVDCITGAAFAVRSEIYKALGGLDELFFMYFEEVDFCKRMKATFHQEIVLLPQIKVFHLFGRSSIQTDVRQTVYYESYYHYFKKHHGRRSAFLLRALIIFNAIARLVGIQIKYFPLAKGWKQCSRKTLSTFRLLLWALGLRKTSRGRF